jgi:signal transduction histidine kinase
LHNLVEALRNLNLAAFVVLAAASVRLWVERRGAAARWAMLAFADLAVIELVGLVVPDEPSGIAEHAVQRLEVALLLLFPFLLFRFTTAFVAPRRLVAAVLRAMTAAMIVWTAALPSFPGSDDDWSALFAAYLACFLVHWTVLSSLTASRLWRAGGAQPSVARRRMRLLATASALLTFALFFVAGSSDSDSAFSAAAQALAFVSVVAFLLGLTPPSLLRLYWREPEQWRLQEAIGSLVALATTRREVAERVLPPMAAIVGARGVALRDADGTTIGSYEVARGRPEAESEELELEIPGGGSLAVWTGPYAPFFGVEELRLLRTLGALTGIALDRVRLFEQEHESRVALVRANEVMSNFVSLAAHELRTPITTIHGFVHTLNHLGDRLAPDQREEVSRTLEQQTQRMALLVEQLLDLSRLDADAIDIVPQLFDVRSRLEELVGATAAGRPGEVELDVDGPLEAELDPSAFDRIVSNLVTNAFRYGEPPVVVHAERSDHHFRLSVEDRGPGVPDEFVPDLFERFSRSDAARERAVGTGLGLAIARSYARAHGGDRLYEPARPHGARFQLVLPAPGRAA